MHDFFQQSPVVADAVGQEAEKEDQEGENDREGGDD